KGKRLDDLREDEDLEKSDDEEYYDEMDNYMQEVEANGGKLSRKEIMENIIKKSKLLKMEKQNLKNAQKHKIDVLDSNFGELSMLLKKRPREFSKFNDNYDRNVSKFNYSEKTHPTDRVKTEKELNMEKELEMKKQKRRNKQEEIEYESDKESVEEVKEDKKKLTKSERIQKLIEQRLKRAGVKEDENKITVKKKKKNEDNLSDLEEFE